MTPSPYDNIPPPKYSRKNPVAHPDIYQDAARMQQQANQPPTQPIFPEELQRGRSYTRGTRQQLPQQPLPPNLQRAKEAFQEQYQERPEEYIPVPPKKKRSIADLLVVIGFFIFFILGVASSAINFIYARDATKMPTAMAFIHADILAVLICVMFLMIMVWRGK